VDAYETLRVTTMDRAVRGTLPAVDLNRSVYSQELIGQTMTLFHAAKRLPPN
jgi:hypothetical protein